MTSGCDTLNADISGAGADIHRLSTLAEGPSRQPVVEMEQTYAKLADAWRGFYDSLGVDDGRAVMFQVQAEPLGRRVLQILPAMQKQQNEAVQVAEARDARVTRLTDR